MTDAVPDAMIRFRCACCGREEEAPAYLPGNKSAGLDIARTPDCAYEYIIRRPLRAIGWEDLYFDRSDYRGGIVCGECKKKAQESERARRKYQAAADMLDEAFEGMGLLGTKGHAKARRALDGSWKSSWQHDVSERLRASPGSKDSMTLEFPVRCAKSGCGRVRTVAYTIPQPVEFRGTFDLMKGNGEMDQGWLLTREMGFSGYMWCPDHKKEGAIW